MEKDLMQEFLDELAQLLAEEKISGLNPDVARGRSIEALMRVIRNHKITKEEAKAFVQAASALDGEISANEAEIINAL